MPRVWLGGRYVSLGDDMKAGNGEMLEARPANMSRGGRERRVLCYGFDAQRARCHDYASESVCFEALDWTTYAHIFYILDIVQNQICFYPRSLCFCRVS